MNKRVKPDIQYRFKEMLAIENMRFFKKDTQAMNLMERVLIEIWHEIMEERRKMLPQSVMNNNGKERKPFLNRASARGVKTTVGRATREKGGKWYPQYMREADEGRK